MVILCLGVLPTFMNTVCAPAGTRKKIRSCLGLEFQMVVSHLGIEPGTTMLVIAKPSPQLVF